MHYIAWRDRPGRGAVPRRLRHEPARRLPDPCGRHRGSWDAAISPGALFDLGWLAATGALLWAYARPLGVGPRLGGRAPVRALSPERRRLARGPARLPALPLPARGRLRRGALDRAGGALGPLVWGGLALGIGHDGEAARGRVLAGRGGARRVGRVARRPLAACGPGHRARRRSRRARAGLRLARLARRPRALRGGLQRLRGAAVQPRRPRPRVAALRRAIASAGRSGACWRSWPCSACRPRRPASRPARRWRRSASISGALHFALQGKGWEYQLYPLAVFLCALAPFALRRLSLAAWERHGHPSMPVRFPGSGARPRSCSSPPPPWCSAPRGWTRSRSRGSPTRRAGSPRSPATWRRGCRRAPPCR